MLKSLLWAAVLALATPCQARWWPGHHHHHESDFWYAAMDHVGPSRGYAPHLDDRTTYEVFMEARAHNGEAIQAAIDLRSSYNGTKRQGSWLASQPRVVYIPPGTYEVRQTINMTTDTILVGDATNPPVLKAAEGFIGSTLLNGQDPTTGLSGEISFAVGLKNLVLDSTSIDCQSNFTALYWGVAQVAQLQNMKIVMPEAHHGKGHTGIRLGRGSTLAVADARIEHGQYGIHHDGHQQALFKNVYFHKNAVGMYISGGYTITLLNPTFYGVGTAVKNTGLKGAGDNPFVALLDARSIQSGVTFHSNTTPSIVIDNLDKDTNSNIVELPSGVALGPARHVNTFSYGNTVGRTPIYGNDSSPVPPRPQILAPGGRYPAVPAPNYANLTVHSFINAKDPRQNGGVFLLGDASVDDAPALNKILQYAADHNKILYLPYGDYRVHSTVFVPVGSQIIGEAWSTISAGGDFFKDASHPQPVVQLGAPGNIGRIHVQDIRVTVSDVLPGAILMQVHAAGQSPGDVALWNSALLIGGTRGADGLTNACTDPSNECQAVFLGLHLAPGSSAYIENVWNWVADHITEEFEGGCHIAGRGGALVETDAGTWIYGLGSEHWWLYQLNLREASNVLVALLQTETNYEQGDNTAQIVPEPWTLDVEGWGDPDYSWCGKEEKRCRMGLSNYIQGGSDIYYYGSASWVFFSGPGYQPCVDDNYTCQEYIHWIEGMPENLQAYGMCARGVEVVLRLGDGTEVRSQEGFVGSWTPDGSLVGRYTV